MQSPNPLGGNDFRADRGLQFNDKLLFGNQLFELFHHSFARFISILLINHDAKSFDNFFGHYNVQLNHVRFAEIEDLVIHRSIAGGDAFKFIIKIRH